MNTVTAWVTDSGEFGSNEILTFDYDTLTEAQWEQLDRLADSDRLPFVQAVIAGEDLSEFDY